MNSVQGVRQKLKDARKAVARKAFAEAKTLFAEVLESPDMDSDIDIRLRHAYCAEQSGDYTDALASYRKVLSIYLDQGEKAAADKLEARIDDLELAGQKVQKSKKAKPKSTVRKIQSNAVPMGRSALIQRLFKLGIPRHLERGDVLCKANEPPMHLWLLRSGSLTVKVEDYEEQEVMTPNPNALMLVGEGGFFTHQPREATVTAKDSVEVIEIGRDEVMVERNADPTFAAAMDMLLLDYWIAPVLSRHEIFARINDVDRYRLARELEWIEINAGQTLIEANKEHHAAYMVLSGCAFLTYSDPSQGDNVLASNDGTSTISLFPADVINLPGLLRGNLSPYKVVAGTPLQLLRLSLESFEPYTLRRAWIVNAILKISRKPARLQVNKPDESYRWFIDRHIDVSA